MRLLLVLSLLRGGAGAVPALAAGAALAPPAAAAIAAGLAAATAILHDDVSGLSSKGLSSESASQLTLAAMLAAESAAASFAHASSATVETIEYARTQAAELAVLASIGSSLKGLFDRIGKEWEARDGTSRTRAVAEAGGKKVIDMWDRLDELWKRNGGPEAADAAAKKAQELARRGATKAREVTGDVIKDPRVQKRLSPELKRVLNDGITQEDALEWIGRQGKHLVDFSKDPKVFAFSPTAPISPICRTPLFPDLTFYSCFSGFSCSPTHPFLPYVAPHFSHISHFDLFFKVKETGKWVVEKLTKIRSVITGKLPKDMGPKASSGQKSELVASEGVASDGVESRAPWRAASMKLFGGFAVGGSLATALVALGSLRRRQRSNRPGLRREDLTAHALRSNGP